MVQDVFVAIDPMGINDLTATVMESLQQHQAGARDQAKHVLLATSSCVDSIASILRQTFPHKLGHLVKSEKAFDKALQQACCYSEPNPILQETIPVF